MHSGTLAIAVVHRQVVVVQAARSHSGTDRWMDVYTYMPLGERLFLTSAVPKARIERTDILSVLPSTGVSCFPEQGMLELPLPAFSEFVELSARVHKRHENLWSAMVAAH